VNETVHTKAETSDTSLWRLRRDEDIGNFVKLKHFWSPQWHGLAVAMIIGNRWHDHKFMTNDQSTTLWTMNTLRWSTTILVHLSFSSHIWKKELEVKDCRRQV